jgi:hypothetical protein
VTKEAIITTNEGILTLSGMTPESNEITILDPIRTKVVAIPIPKPFNEDDVVARVGHMPSIRTRIGFSFKKPFVKFDN